jgi:hypothetical protein
MHPREYASLHETGATHNDILDVLARSVPRSLYRNGREALLPHGDLVTANVHTGDLRAYITKRLDGDTHTQAIAELTS